MNPSDAVYQAWFLLHNRYLPNPHDYWYIKVGEQLYSFVMESKMFKGSEQEALGFVSAFFSVYLEDCVTGEGGWCRFVKHHKELYNKPLPFYKVSREYAQGKVNLEDLLFLTWSLISGPVSEGKGQLFNPLDEAIILFAEVVFDILQSNFPDAPIGKGDSVDWVTELNYFEKSYNVMSDFDGIGTPYLKLLNEGHPIGYVESFSQLNRIFTNELNFFDRVDYATLYEKSEQELGDSLDLEEPYDVVEELLQYKDASQFVVFSYNTKLIVGANIAPYFKDKRNKLYNEELAVKKAHTLFLTPKKCPLPILRYAMEHQLLPDATLPIPNGKQMLHENWDFIARWFLKEDYVYKE